MTLAVRPPEYFPRLAFAALMLIVDRFVVADTFSYSRQSTQNRCRIRTAGEGDDSTIWLTVPVVGKSPGRHIHRVEIAPGDEWRRIHRKTLLHHYGSAPFFAHYQPEIEALIDTPAKSLADLTTATVRWVASTLQVQAGVVRALELPGCPGSLEDVLRAETPSQLITLPESVDRDAAAAAAIAVGTQVVRFHELPRRQNFPGFTPECSVLDLIMNHGPASADYLRNCVQ